MAVIALAERETRAGIASHLSLGMAQLSPFGLSEQWLLREAGDRHWQLIADRLGQRGIGFRDAGGRMVYAAFCATSLKLGVPSAPLLGCEVELHSSLHALGRHRLGSLHRVSGAEGEVASLAMISCFLRHDESGSNRRLLRTALPGLGLLPAAPPEVLSLAERAKSAARVARAWDDRGEHLLSHMPVPSLDFNAVGLLYFPTFSKIAEMAMPSPQPLAQREVVYLSNLDPGERVDAVSTGRARMTLTSGNRVLGLVRTLRR